MALDTNKSWIELLDEEDMSFMKRFILLSGSLKDLAKAYDVSYPTVRLRLDRLIQKIEISDRYRQEDRYEVLLRAQFADGKMDAGAFKQLLAVYQKQKKDSK